MSMSGYASKKPRDDESVEDMRCGESVQGLRGHPVGRPPRLDHDAASLMSSVVETAPNAHGCALRDRSEHADGRRESMIGPPKVMLSAAALAMSGFGPAGVRITELG